MDLANGPTGITVPQSTRRSIPRKTVNTTNMAKHSSVKQLHSVRGRQYANPGARLILFPVVGLMVPRLSCVGPSRTVVRDRKNTQFGDIMSFRARPPRNVHEFSWKNSL